MKKIFFTLLIAAGLFSSLAFNPQADNGVTDTEILVGMSTALEGPAAFLGTSFKMGADAYFNHINANGGIHGRKIRVLAYDDGYEPSRCVANINKLIKEDNVFALFGNVGTPTTMAVKPVISREKVPMFAPFTGAGPLRNPVVPYILNYRASYNQEVEAFVAGIVDELGMSKIAVMYQNDAYGRVVLQGAKIALEKRGLEIVARGTYERNTTDISEGLAAIAPSGAEAVVIVGTYGAAAKFIADGKNQGFDPVFMNVSFVGSDKMLELLGSTAEGEVVTQTVPPHTSNLPGVQEYRTRLKAAFPGEAPNFVSLEGYLAAKVFVEGLKRAGQDLTRDGFVAAVETISDYDIGAGNTVSFSASNHQGSQKVYPTVIRNGKYEIIEDWNSLRGLLTGND